MTSAISKHTSTCLKTLEEHLQAENDHSLESIMVTYGAAPVVNINRQLFEGMEKIHFFHDRFGFGGDGSFSNVHVTEKKRRVCEDSVILEQELSGKHTATWQGHPPTGKTFKIPVCTIYSFNELGKLAREDVYFDSAGLMRQLGLS